MNQATNKEKILHEALNLFSTRGYDAVSVKDIASKVGIKAPSLYNHFESKQDIFNALVEENQIRYERYVSGLSIGGTNGETDGSLYVHIDENQLVEIGKNLFLFFLHDEYTSKFRKLVQIEKYCNFTLSAWYVKQYIDDPLGYHSALFSKLIEEGVLKNENTKIMGLHFFAPIYMMLNLCDSDSSREAEALSVIEEHIKQFNRFYKRKGERENEILEG